MLKKEVLAVSLKLFVITAVAALCLAVVNKVTKPVIEENNKQTEIRLQQEVLPEAAEFTMGEIPKLDNAKADIEKISVGISKPDGKVCGYVVVATSHEGYGGDLKVMVGVDSEFEVTRIKIMESSETAGLGANASKPEFADQFVGADSTLSVVKGTAKENEISAIASATVTSNAVTSCVNTALEAAKQKGQNVEIAKTAKRLEEIKQQTAEQISKEEGGEKK